MIDFLKFSNDAIELTKCTPGSAGFDLNSTENILVAPSRIINTCIGFTIPRDNFRKIHARSSFAVKFTHVSAGVINSDHRGPVCVLFFNFSNNIIETEKDLPFAQIVFQKCARPSLREVETFDPRSTLHGQNGFCSTGLKYFFFIFKYFKKKKTHFANKYIPDYCPPDIPWYERDGVLTWYNQNKYTEFSKNPEEYLKNKKVINFDILIN